MRKGCDKQFCPPILDSAQRQLLSQSGVGCFWIGHPSVGSLLVPQIRVNPGYTSRYGCVSLVASFLPLYPVCMVCFIHSETEGEGPWALWV